MAEAAEAEPRGLEPKESEIGGTKERKFARSAAKQRGNRALMGPL